jgi:hypothetical protein
MHRGLAEKGSWRNVRCSKFLIFADGIISADKADNLAALAPDIMLDRIAHLPGAQ